MSSFQDLEVYNKTEALAQRVTRSWRRTGFISAELQDRERACFMPTARISFFASVINEKPINLERTTSSGLYIILIYL